MLMESELDRELYCSRKHALNFLKNVALWSGKANYVWTELSGNLQCQSHVQTKPAVDPVSIYRVYLSAYSSVGYMVLSVVLTTQRRMLV
jgi:hypothetical protein